MKPEKIKNKRNKPVRKSETTTLISGSIITLNEKNNIEECVASMDFCDEIVVVDSFSTDGTLEVLERLKKKYVKNGPRIKIVKKKFIGYGPQKNLATKLCSHDWVLSLDADERVSDELRQSLLEWSKGGHESFGGYNVNRRNYYLSRWVYYNGWYPDKRIRFYNKKRGHWDDVQVHESYNIKTGKTGFLKGDLLHYTIMSLEDHMDNINRFTTIAAREEFERGKTSGVVKMISKTLFTFIKMFFIKRGFLDGKHGFVLSVMSSSYSFVKYAKIWHLQTTKAKINREKNSG